MTVITDITKQYKYAHVFCEDGVRFPYTNKHTTYTQVNNKHKRQDKRYRYSDAI